jgi:hypothetical protein
VQQLVKEALADGNSEVEQKLLDDPWASNT